MGTSVYRLLLGLLVLHIPEELGSQDFRFAQAIGLSLLNVRAKKARRTQTDGLLVIEVWPTDLFLGSAMRHGLHRDSHMVHTSEEVAIRRFSDNAIHALGAMICRLCWVVYQGGPFMPFFHGLTYRQAIRS